MADRPPAGGTSACAGVTDESHAQALAILRLYEPLIEVTSRAGVLRGR